MPKRCRRVPPAPSPALATIDYSLTYNEIAASGAPAIVFRCDAVEKDLYEHLQHLGRHLKNVSGIDYENWGTVKLATAFKIICSRKIDKSDEMFSDDVRSKLLDDADKYKDLVFPTGCIANYKKILGLNILRNDKMDQLAEFVKVARIKAEHVRVKPMLNRSLNLLQAK
uniref:Uncharacterized protein n=1 Tax=Oryza nivara TaxID=4536 RepID=A0A0E0J2U3_ORYNI